MSTKLELALFSCALLGLRHGFDYDHLAAITDITSVQRSLREGMRLGLLYALGHAATIAVLGTLVIAFRLALPAHMDAVGERIVGATLLLLTAHIVIDLFRKRGLPAHNHAPRSRVALLISGTQHLVWRLRRVRNAHLPQPAPFGFEYGQTSVFLVGVLHGLGAETPSQLVLFLLAANLGGTGLGFLGLLCFVLGLLTMNTLMTASASGVFASGRHRPRLQLAATVVTVAYSFSMGIVFLFGISDRLPPLAP